MKTLQKILGMVIIPLMMILLLNCKGETSKDTAHSDTQKITLNFTAELIGDYVFVGADTFPEPKCLDPFIWRAIVKAKGNSDTLGAVRAYFDFCGDSIGNYGNGYAFMVVETGDSLFFDCRGQVLDGRLDEHPEFVTSFWKDTFDITGGSGKFAGASGQVISDDFNSSEDLNSHHRWTGTIQMVK